MTRQGDIFCDQHCRLYCLISLKKFYACSRNIGAQDPLWMMLMHAREGRSAVMVMHLCRVCRMNATLELTASWIE